MGTQEEKGFSLIELMVVLSVAALLLGLAVPLFTDAMANSRMSTAINDFGGSLHAARSEALKEESRSCCARLQMPSEDAACSADASFGAGWIVFADGDGNGTPDGSDTILQRRAPRMEACNSAPCPQTAAWASTASSGRPAVRGIVLRPADLRPPRRPGYLAASPRRPMAPLECHGLVRTVPREDAGRIGRNRPAAADELDVRSHDDTSGDFCRTRSRRRHSAGFTLVESLVALVVPAVGMLGIAVLYVEGLRAGRTAVHRTTAVTLAADMADRIRANPAGGIAYAGTGPGEDLGCVNGSEDCSPAELAADDWSGWLADIRARLPAGSDAEIQVTPAAGVDPATTESRSAGPNRGRPYRPPTTCSFGSNPVIGS